MSEPKDLIEQLRRSNRRWKALALASCFALVLAALISFAHAVRERMRAERALRDVSAALASAQKAANPGQPR
jgi:hypothetical protein